MTDGEKILALAEKHLGERYDNHCPEVPLDDDAYKGPWDCAEFVTWCIYQITGKKVGHRNGSGGAYTGYWENDMSTLCKVISRKQAKHTKGAIFFKFPPAKGKKGHIAFSDGEGGTVEARNEELGVCRAKILFRGWDAYLLVKGISY
jgi:N-acetylmuramoyl-L-alanine amidase